MSKLSDSIPIIVLSVHVRQDPLAQLQVQRRQRKKRKIRKRLTMMRQDKMSFHLTEFCNNLDVS